MKEDEDYGVADSDDPEFHVLRKRWNENIDFD